MPSYSYLNDQQLEAVTAYLMSLNSEAVGPGGDYDYPRRRDGHTTAASGPAQRRGAGQG
ncbi:MAG: hypothetical protein HZY76_03220 [Anaerolineae bacterium]|nr:MAG: hypothetical protein HZY76_03220 [Anaerolineae bacterium]